MLGLGGEIFLERVFSFSEDYRDILREVRGFSLRKKLRGGGDFEGWLFHRDILEVFLWFWGRGF